jgi:RNA:NAD 2'-phosphotransferase (TPT1/KptA family)
MQKFELGWNEQPLNQQIAFEYVWHGTLAQNVYDICIHGFDPSRRRNQVHGPGVYFSRDANISNSYCKPDANGLNRMIVALALRVPQSKFLDNQYVVVNNPTSSNVSYVLPMLVVTFGLQPPNYVFESAFRIGMTCERVLYHQTTLEAAKNILEHGFDLGQSKAKTLVGKGIYFATHPRSTIHKASRHGALLRVTVAVGLSLDVPFRPEKMDYPVALASQVPPRSSIRIPRNDWNHQPTEDGAEYVVFDVSQIKSIKCLSLEQYSEIPNLS